MATPCILAVNVFSTHAPSLNIPLIRLYQNNSLFWSQQSKMPPSGLAILIGAGPNTVRHVERTLVRHWRVLQGTGIARILSHPSHGNLAIALLARRSESLNEVVSTVRKTNPNAVLETFPTDTTKASLEKTFQEIEKHQSFKDLKLKLAIYSIKHSSKKPFLEETREDFEDSLETYVGGAFTFAQESLKRFFADHGESGLVDGGDKKGVSACTFQSKQSLIHRL